MVKTFKDMQSVEPGSVLVVDSFNLGFRWLHKGAKKFCDEYVATVESLRKSYKCQHVVLACDWGSSSYRKLLLPEYKENRKEKQALQTPEEAQKFQDFFKEYMNTLDYYKSNTNVPVLRYQGVEADDIGAYIVKRRKALGIKRIVLVSTDRDWDLLVSEDVMRFSYVTAKEVRLDNWREHYDYAPDDHISVKCLMGDSGDNIPGVAGIGPKKAAALVASYGTTYDIIANLPISSKYKHINSLNAFGSENLILNYKLMDLLEHCDEALGNETCESITSTLQELINAN